MKYAIIDFQGHQYQVKEGQEIVVDRLDLKKGDKIKIDKILLIKDGDKVEVGTPVIKNTSIAAKLIEQLKGKKIRVATFKAKSRYRRVKGFRPYLSRIKIEKIEKVKK